MTPPTRAARRRFAAALEQQLRVAQLLEGEQWYLVSCRWWARVLGAPQSDRSDDEATDDDDDDGETAVSARRPCDASVTNAVLLELAMSSRQRHVTVLRPLLVRAVRVAGVLILAGHERLDWVWLTVVGFIHFDR